MALPPFAEAPEKVSWPPNVLSLERAMLAALDALDSSLTVMVMMSPIWCAFTSWKSEQFEAAHREPVGARLEGCGPGSGSGAEATAASLGGATAGAGAGKDQKKDAAKPKSK